MEFLRKIGSKLVEHLLLTVIGALALPFMITFLTGTLSSFLSFLNSETPVWALIVFGLILLVAYNYIGQKSFHPYVQDSETFLMEDSDLKWKVIDFKNGNVSVDYTPYCIEHEAQYIETDGHQYMCREIFASECVSKIIDVDELGLLNRLAKSKADQVSNKYGQIKRKNKKGAGN